MELGERIRAIRVTMGETMEQFGKRFNTSKGTVNNWEKGRNAPNKANLKKIAELSDDPREFITLYLTRV
ncbi:TPA: helix-turn-helix transcriptional regulator [Streptococcus suis 14A]|nr:helix-turn-helix transcriptional regulator [Streptococcus suis 14A]